MIGKVDGSKDFALQTFMEGKFVSGIGFCNLLRKQESHQPIEVIVVEEPLKIAIKHWSR
jgi:hypothetical protein